MTTISCKRCGTTFDTQATTATRCRSCRSVVHLSSRQKRPSTTPRVDTGRARGSIERDGPHGGEIVRITDDGDPVALVAFVAVVVIQVGSWLFWHLRARRHERAARRPDSGAPTDPIGPYDVSQPITGYWIGPGAGA